MNPPLLILFLLSLTSLSPQLFAQNLHWNLQNSGVHHSLRGLHVINDSVVWVSGARGSLLRSLDGGQYWQKLAPPDSLDFRSLWAFDENTALIASAGQPACLYRTQDGGKHWQLVLKDSTGEAFFDALSFSDSLNGLLLSDPVKGKSLLLKTTDGGLSWERIPMPDPAPGEAFFAASNGSIAQAGTQHVWIGSGGSTARVFHSPDGGTKWQLQPVKMPGFSKAAGIYALAFTNTKRGVAVGGAYDRPWDGAHAAYYTTNGGKSWNKARQSPQGYRAAVAVLHGQDWFIAVGTNGSDMSSDQGKNWKKINDLNLNSIRFSPTGQRAWAVGPKGAIYLILIKPS